MAAKMKITKEPNIHLFESIANRFALLTFLIVVGTAATIGYLQYRASALTQIEREGERLDFAVQKASQYLNDRIDELERITTFLADTPALHELAERRGPAEVSQNNDQGEQDWQRQLSDTFMSLAGSNPDIRQIRFIDASEEGREVVRVSRRRGLLTVTPAVDLQHRGETPYVRQTLNAAPGEVVLYDIALNQERGRAEYPYVPVMRAATPVYSSKGNVLGVVVVNMDMRTIFGRLAEDLVGDRKFYLTDEVGEYLVHPDPAKAFGSVLGREANLQSEYPDLSQVVNDRARTEFAAIIDTADGKQIVHAAKIP